MTTLWQGTPFPWELRPGGGHAKPYIAGSDAVQTGGDLDVIHLPSGTISNRSYSDTVCVIDGNTKLPAVIANVRLMLGAPGLLKACQRMLIDLEAGMAGEVIGRTMNEQYEDICAAVDGALNGS